MREKICCIFNLAPHYRESIYTQMDKELQCDFYFGDKVDSPIKIMNVNSLTGYKKTVKNIHLFNTGWLWLSGTWRLIFKPYKHYILTGDPYILSNHVICILARLLNKKTYVWSHGMKGSSNPKRRLLEHVFFRLCHKVLLYGEHSKNIMINEGFKESRLIPIYNSLDYDKQLKIRKTLKPSGLYEHHFKNSNPVLIYIGRIQKSKKLDLLLSAMHKLNNDKQYCNLVIIGEDVDNTNLDIQVEELKLINQVWFYGPCYEEKVIGELIFNADLCVSPGPIGLTALHAMTYGTPIVTNDNFSKQMPEFEVIVKNKTGDFYREGNLEDMTDKIANWINLDSEKRNNIRKNATLIIDSKYNPHYQLKTLKNVMKLNN